MKMICTIVLAAFILAIPLSLWSQDEAEGAKLFKTKCIGCHGANGEGKPSMKMPAARGTAMSVEQIVDYLTKGEAGKKIHSKPMGGFSPEQAKLVAEYVKSLK
jgi:mono/diheme cytochrome c family protein